MEDEGDMASRVIITMSIYIPVNTLKKRIQKYFKMQQYTKRTCLYIHENVYEYSSSINTIHIHIKFIHHIITYP